MDQLYVRIAGCIGIALVIAVAKIAYNAFLHPLAKHPGPRLARVTRLWSRYANLDGRKSELIHEAHRKYGKHMHTAGLRMSQLTYFHRTSCEGRSERTLVRGSEGPPGNIYL